MVNATFVPPESAAHGDGIVGFGATLVPNVDSSSELERMRAELDRLNAQQQELMKLLGTTRPDRIVHDVRNLLQERMFLEAACKRFGG